MYQIIAPVISTSPIVNTGRTPIRVDERLRDAGDGDDGSRGREERQSGLECGVVQHLLHVERQQEEVREDDGAEEDAADVGAGHRAHAEDAERHDRRRMPRLDHEERRKEHSRTDQLLDRVGGAPADLGRLRDRIDEQRETRRDRHCAAGIEARASPRSRLSRTIGA